MKPSPPSAPSAAAWPPWAWPAWASAPSPGRLARNVRAVRSYSLVDIGRGAKMEKSIAVKWGFPLNHNKQQCNMFPNSNHDCAQVQSQSAELALFEWHPLERCVRGASQVVVLPLAAHLRPNLCECSAHVALCKPSPPKSST